MRDRLITAAITAAIIYLNREHPHILWVLFGLILLIGLLAVNADRIAAWNEKNLKGQDELPDSKRDKDHKE